MIIDSNSPAYSSFVLGKKHYSNDNGATTKKKMSVPVWPEGDEPV